ncbi:MAG: hypothetical protein ABJA57_13510, partial [Ginsengibacter sp.]
TFNVKMDPRVKTSLKDLQLLNELSLKCYHYRLQIAGAMSQLISIRNKVESRKDPNLQWPHLQKEADSIFYSRAAPGAISFTSIDGSLARLINILEEADARPTSQVFESVKKITDDFNQLWLIWSGVLKKIETL